MSDLKTLLLIIDPQNDFMDTPGSALRVPGASDDMERLAKSIRRHGDAISKVMVTLDTHMPDHIAQAVRWVDKSGNHPAPFTLIFASQVQDGTYRAADPTDQKWQEKYVFMLEELGKHLIIWPPHCELGTPGHAIHAGLYATIRDWWTTRPDGPFQKVEFIQKGLLRDTEQYGAFCAEVPVSPELDLSLKQMNIRVNIDYYDRILIAGEALSHCVAESIDQIFEIIPQEHAKKYTLLVDCTSPVDGYEDKAEEWLKNARARGMQCELSISYDW